MPKVPKEPRKTCAKPTIYKTPRGDYMTDLGDGRIVPAASKLALHDIPEEFLDLATIYDAPAYQIQFIGAGTSIDAYARSIEELFQFFALLRENYIIENGEQELRFYRLSESDGWRSLGGLYGADIVRADINLGEFATIFAEEAQND